MGSFLRLSDGLLFFDLTLINSTKVFITYEGFSTIFFISREKQKKNFFGDLLPESEDQNAQRELFSLINRFCFDFKFERNFLTNFQSRKNESKFAVEFDRRSDNQRSLQCRFVIFHRFKFERKTR